MRVIAVICCAVLFVIGCDAATKTPAGTPETLSVPAGFTFVDGVSLLVGAADDPKAPCGLARDFKIGGRVDPGTDQGNGTWAISGCFYAHGSELWNPQVMVVFPRSDGGQFEREIVAIAAPVHVARDHREVQFGTTVRRASLSGMRAYLVTYFR
jgi:hypothetical protein